MTANVRCAGDGEPCGWKGSRFPSTERAWVRRSRLPGRFPNEEQLFKELATAKPCPRCDGRVELIPTDGAL